ncbi:MAG TPA: hypothetical protein PKD53_07145 [Chloroflexaceae bacterium]|nr:hypothetical protein [Chloroflexaceae bacterium]
MAELQGDHGRARDFADTALAIARAEGIPPLVPRALIVRGQAQAGLGDDAATAESYIEAFARDMDFGHAPRSAAGAVALAAARHALGDLAGAYDLLVPQLALLLCGPLTGMDEPIRTLLSAAELLRAQGELARRVELVRPERHEAFLNAIPAHRELQQGMVYSE